MSASIAAEALEALRGRFPSGQHLFSKEDRDRIVAAAMAPLDSAPPHNAVDFVLAGIRVMHSETAPSLFSHALNHAVSGLLRRKLPFTEDQVFELIDLVSLPHREFPFRGVLSAVETLGFPLSPRIVGALTRLRPMIDEYLGGSEMRILHGRIDNLLNGPAPETALTPEGAWSQAVLREVAVSPHKEDWERIFAHAAGLKPAEAPRKWRVTAGEMIDALGRDTFFDAARRWLALGPSPDRAGVQLTPAESDYQRGFLWFQATSTDERMPALLANFAEGALKKIPSLGAVSQKVGNACVNVLAEIPGLGPVAQLSRLAQRIKYDTAQRLIQEALDRAAAKAGVTRDQLEEMSTPDYGLDPGGDGTRAECFGEYTARLAIADTTSVTVDWTDSAGKPLKSVPAAAKNHHRSEWNELQSTVKDLEKMLVAQRRRVERLLLTQRAIPIETFRKSYLDHPLLADMSRRLIWQFDDQAASLGVWREGRLVDTLGGAFDLTASKTARLWHPASSDVQTVFDWRCWLEDHGIRQPFKQAHREVYLITSAERETATYSNRFAAHILRQAPFAALAAQRGWEFRVMGQWDSHNTPTLELPEFGLSVQYEVDFPENEQEVTGHYIYLLIRTGAVRFIDTATRKSRVLDSLPPIVFSEAMRDVDLFTGVASIGNDPAWGQARPNPPFEDYWNAFSFGELTELARNRAAILERILPRLAIADRCRLEGRFLNVRGHFATYRIHLGSGNILMEPGSRYLCIVEGAATKSKPRNLALPFEDDHKLAQILSKAFLLADDKNVKDESIRRQFNPG